MAIKTYKKGSKEKLSANFKASEFACKGSGCCSAAKIDEQLVAFLQLIRDHFGKKLYITSGYRCAAHNKKVGGASGSRHTKGQAADFFVEGVAPAEVAKYAERIGVLGIGLYGPEDGDFVHIDTRTSKSFWYGHKQEKRTTFGGGEYTLGMRILHRGCSGEDVRALQILLTGRNCKGSMGTPDGNYGPKTVGAVEAYQEKKGLPVTGVADERTMCSLMGM